MRRARLVARRMSSAAPVVTLSSPKISSSATRPPNRLVIIAFISSLDWLYLSRSGRNIVTPKARPRGMIVTLCNGSRAPANNNHQALPGPVEGGEGLFLLGHHHRAPLGAHHDLVLGVLELGHRHRALAAPRRHQGRLVDEIGEIGAGEAGGAAGDDLRVDIGGERHLAHVDL